MKLRAYWYADVLALARRVNGRLGLTLFGHWLRFVAVILLLLAFPAIFGAHGLAGTAFAATILFNPTARTVFAILGYFPFGLYQTVGNGSADDTTGMQNALNAAGVTGGTAVGTPGRDYKFTSLLAVPACVVLLLGMGTTLSCAVTGGGDGITLGDAAMIRGMGAGGGGSAGTKGALVRTLSGANVDALITNATVNQEFVYLRGVFVTAGAGSTVRSLVDFVSVYFNSGGEDCVLDSATVAKNCLRVRTGGSSNCGQVTFTRTWFNRPAQDCVLIEGAGAPGAGTGAIGDVWFNYCLFENWGIGVDDETPTPRPTGGLKINAPSSVIPHIALKGGHFENAAVAATATQCVYANKASFFSLEDMDCYIPYPTNYSGVVWTNATENQGGYIRNFDSSSTLAKLIDDQRRGIVVNDAAVGAYSQGGTANSRYYALEGFRTGEGGTAPRMGIATLVGGTKVVSTTAVTASSRIFLTSQVDGGTPGFLRVSARTAGTSFTILSSSGADTSQVGWKIEEPA